MNIKKQFLSGTLLVGCCLGSFTGVDAKSKKAKTTVAKARIVVAPPRTFTRDLEPLPAFVNIGTLNLEDSSFYSYQDVEEASHVLLQGNVVGLGGVASSIETNLGYIKGVGIYDVENKLFTATPSTYLDVKGPSDVTPVVDSGIFSGVRQADGAFRSVGWLLKDPYAKVGLTLSNAASHVMLDLAYSDQSIDLNGGSVTLGRDLKFGDDTRFVRGGTVFFNGKTLTFGGVPLFWDTDIIWNNAADLQFSSKVTVTSRWYFDGDGHVSANGNIIDLSSGGQLWIRSGTQVSFSNLKIKGLGSGSIVFEDPSARILLSDVELEMDNDITFTTGGVYIEGPTTIITKNHVLLLDQAASLTVDGTTLWYDTLDQPDSANIQPRVDDDVNVNNKYITYLNHAIISQKNWNAGVRTSSNALTYYAAMVRGNSDLLRQTSNVLHAYVPLVHATSVLLRQSSNVLNAYAPTIRNTSYLARATSDVMHRYAPIIRNNSYLLKDTSNALAYYAPIVRNNSTLLCATSDAIHHYAQIVVANSLLLNALSADVRNSSYLLKATSDALLYGLRTNSNALEFYHRVNSNMIDYHHRITSNALLYGDRINSNTLAYNNRINSNSAAYHTRINSNTLAYNFRTNSNALEFYHRVDSNMIDYHHRITSNALLYGDRINSNTLAYNNRINSNSAAYHARINSNTLAYNFRINSNLVDYIYRELADLETGGQGHIYFSRIDDLYQKVRYNSNAILYHAGVIDNHFTVTHTHQTIANIRFIKQGFTIEDGNTLHLNTPLRLSGSINLGASAQGTLHLDGDLTLAQDCYFTAPGFIDGSGHTLNLTGSFVVPAGVAGLTFVGDTFVYGNGQEVSFAPGACMCIDDTVSVTLSHLVLLIDQPTLFTGGGHLTLQDVVVRLSDDYNKTSGQLFIDGSVCMQGDKAFTVLDDGAVTINPFATWYFDKGAALSYAPSSNNRDLIRMHDATSTLYLDGCSLYSTTTGLRLTSGTLVVDHKNTIHADGSKLSEAITFGSGQTADDLTIKVMPGACLDVASGFVHYANGESD